MLDKEAKSTQEMPLLLADEAYATLKNDIVLSRLAPGKEVSESKLDAAYPFGRAAIRKALVRLGQEGLVVAASRRGTMISPLLLADIKEVFLLRAQLEPFAARLAAGRIDGQLLRILDQACAAGYTRGDHESEIRFLDSNRRFHLAIAEATGNSRLLRWMEQLHNEATRILHFSLRFGDADFNWSHGHETLLEALLRPSAEESERIARILLTRSEQDVYRAILNSPSLLSAPLP